jgi:hypothetical protein
MIFYSIPWSTEKNIGKYYNAFMEKIGEDDYACFIDSDSCFTTTYFGKQIEDIVKKYPECGLFTAMSNRIFPSWQKTGNYNSNDIAEHRIFGKNLFDTKYDNIVDITKKNDLSGVLILISKKVWIKLGGFKIEGMLGIDNDIHYKANLHNEKVYIMTGVFLYHWYRGGDHSFVDHLK